MRFKPYCVVEGSKGRVGLVYMLGNSKTLLPVLTLRNYQVSLYKTTKSEVITR